MTWADAERITGIREKELRDRLLNVITADIPSVDTDEGPSVIRFDPATGKQILPSHDNQPPDIRAGGAAAAGAVLGTPVQEHPGVLPGQRLLPCRGESRRGTRVERRVGRRVAGLRPRSSFILSGSWTGTSRLEARLVLGERSVS